MQLTVHTDGGARGNPGPAAIGVVIENQDKSIELSKRIGESTNNFAEYTAVLEALRTISSRFASHENNEALQINFYLDSNLVVNQLNGTFKVKEATLRILLMQVRLLEQEVGGAIKYFYVPREENRRADLLVNRALDNF